MVGTKLSRNKGGVVILAAQSVAGLRDPELYGQFGAAEILGQIQNKFFGRLECPETAKWANEVIGEQEIRQVTSSGSTSSGGSGGTTSTKSWNEQIVTQSAVLPSQLMSLTPCSELDGLSAYYVNGITGAFHSNLDGKQLFHQDLIPASKTVRNFVPRDIESQYLKPWSGDQRAAFVSMDRLENETPTRRPGLSQSIDDLDRLDEI